MVFISQKFLDTPLFRLIRFRQKVLTALPPLELFSLEKKRPPFAGWPFYLVVSRRSSVVSQQEIRKDSHETGWFSIRFCSANDQRLKTNDEFVLLTTDD